MQQEHPCHRFLEFGKEQWQAEDQIEAMLGEEDKGEENRGLETSASRGLETNAEETGTRSPRCQTPSFGTDEFDHWQQNMEDDDFDDEFAEEVQAIAEGTRNLSEPSFDFCEPMEHVTSVSIDLCGPAQSTTSLGSNSNSGSNWYSTKLKSPTRRARVSITMAEGPKQDPTIVLPGDGQQQDEDTGLGILDINDAEVLSRRFCPELHQRQQPHDLNSFVRGSSKVMAEHQSHAQALTQQVQQRIELASSPRRAAQEKISNPALHSLHCLVAQHCFTQRQSPHQPWKARARLAPPPLKSLEPSPFSICKESKESPPASPRASRPSSRAGKAPDLHYLNIRSREGSPKAKEKQQSFCLSSKDDFDRGPCSSEQLRKLHQQQSFCGEGTWWKSPPSPVQQRLEQDSQFIIVDSQWREFQEELRMGRMRQSKPETGVSVMSGRSTEEVRVVEDVHVGPLVQTERATDQTRKVKDKNVIDRDCHGYTDCPNAHTLHLVRNSNAAALARWGAMHTARPEVLRQALFLAARKGSIAVLNYMHSMLGGTHVLLWQEQCFPGTSLLHAAAAAGSLAVCAWLEEQGADLAAVDGNGKKPFEVATPTVRECWDLHKSFIASRRGRSDSATASVQDSCSSSSCQESVNQPDTPRTMLGLRPLSYLRGRKAKPLSARPTPQLQPLKKVTLMAS